MSDHDLFRRFVKGIKPLEQDRVVHDRKRPAPIPTQTHLDNQRVLKEQLEADFEDLDIETGDELLFVRPGIQKATLRKLRQGKYAVQAELDLHGLFSKQARVAIRDFIRDSQHHGRHCVRIIHGKGHGSYQRAPVLKHKTNVWLRQLDAVLAFASAQPHHGGTGAVYVLLKRG